MCRLKGTTLQSSFRDGDVILGAVMSLYHFPELKNHSFKEKPSPSLCSGAFVRYYRHVLVIMFAVEEINRNPLLLPNVTLGYEIYDSCDYVSNAVEATLKLFSGRQDHVPGYRCTTKGPLVGFIGLPYSMAVLTQIYRYPHELLQTVEGRGDRQHPLSLAVCKTGDISLKINRCLLSGPTVPKWSAATSVTCSCRVPLGVWPPKSMSANKTPMAHPMLVKPVISYGAQDPVLDDKTLFPSFFRIVPNDRSMYAGFVQLLHYFGWTWVGLVTSDEEHNLRTSQELRAVLHESGICIAYFAVVSTKYIFTYAQVARVIEKSKASVVISLCSRVIFVDLIYIFSKIAQHGRVWIIPELFSFSTVLSDLNGSIQFSVHREKIPGFQDFLYSINPTSFPSYFTADFWNDLFLCLPPDKSTYGQIADPKNCTGNESLKIFDSISEIKTFSVTYAVYRTVYSFATVMHKMLLSMQLSGYQLNVRKRFLPTLLSQYLKHINFQIKSGEKLYSANEGPIGQYDIVNWVTSKGTVTYTQIGSFFPFAPAKQQLIINQSDIKWNHKFKQVPKSICSENCPPGYRKVQRKGQPVCCFDCILCSEDEFSNETGKHNGT
ncbi:hypothetical protein XELAEV_18037648mg [Xenopus laevis]|uniref:G-protein coupled receptors family 3 profile domain-containing protein n=1 Tax=Xenopus laevis TaxID=8355 RepID=A0A974CCQ7_XENLA|nr:hypothetical protein XELAEV_18037648mg [Xenopus laevis]